MAPVLGVGVGGCLCHSAHDEAEAARCWVRNDVYEGNGRSKPTRAGAGSLAGTAVRLPLPVPLRDKLRAEAAVDVSGAAKVAATGADALVSPVPASE